MDESPQARARARIDAIFGIGCEQAHDILCRNVEAKRIYDCGIVALATAESEIDRLKEQLESANISR